MVSGWETNPSSYKFEPRKIWNLGNNPNNVKVEPVKIDNAVLSGWANTRESIAASMLRNLNVMDGQIAADMHTSSYSKTAPGVQQQQENKNITINQYQKRVEDFFGQWAVQALRMYVNAMSGEHTLTVDEETRRRLFDIGEEDCIDGNKMHIRQAKVDEGVKGTKTYGSTRTLRIPPYIADLIAKQPHKSEYIVPLSRRTVYEFFQKYTSRAGIQHYRFHDLRHLNTTVQLLLGIDNKTITKRNGWTTDAMIKAVYGHTSTERIDLAAEVIDDYFANKLLTPMQKTL
jgi:hypothetical protein